METEIEEVRREFDKILDDIKNKKIGSDIQKAEEVIFGMLGRIMELSTLRASNVDKILK